ncbi:MAG: sulfatase-like hydrolase/transferase [Planctomycetota bacterium]|jgi:hypothetical protein
MSSAAQRAVRAGAPLLAASAGWGLWVVQPGNVLTALALLVCPGWGLLRLLSALDRHCGVLGGSLMLSLLVLGLATGAAAAYDLPPEQLGLAVHVASLGLCLAGGLALSRHDRWQARQPPHPAPMPLWPARPMFCAALLGLALVALTWAAPIGAPPVGSDLPLESARAQAWLRGGEDPLVAGLGQANPTLLSTAGAALSAASGIHPLRACGLLVGATLAASLLLVAETISRLRGNRGGTRAMLALLLGLNPLALLFLIGHQALLDADASGFQPQLSTALQPWIAGRPTVVTLGFTALLLASTMSVLRRASYHVPRIAGAAAFGLTLAQPVAAVLLVPAWWVGIAFAHLACRDSLDNDPHAAFSSRRAGEPTWLRAPFWALVIPITAGSLGGLLLAGLPALQAGLSTTAAWGLLAALGPTCILFLPGIRHLHRSPGREAWFFIGLLLVAVPAVILLGDHDDLGLRLLALVLAVPAANGALRLIDMHGPRASLLLMLLVVFALPGPLSLVLTGSTGSRAVIAPPGATPVTLRAPRLGHSLEEALGAVAQRAPADAVLIPPDDLLPGDGAVAALVSGRSLLMPPLPGPEALAGERMEVRVRRALARRLPSGDATALLGLRGRPGLSSRELWTVGVGDAANGFDDTLHLPTRVVAHARVPDVILVTVEGLRADEIGGSALPLSQPALSRGLSLERVVSPLPALQPALTSLLTGLAPHEHGVLDARARYDGDTSTLPRVFARQGYRTAAVVALDEDGGLLDDFGRVTRVPGGAAGLLVDMGLAALSEADPRPMLLWLHVSDVARAHRTSPATGGTGRGVVDRALARLLASLPPHDLVLVTSPYGLPRPGEVESPLSESSVHVPLVLLGAGLPAGVSPGLVSLADVPGLLLHGETPRRTSVLLLSDGPAAGLRTATHKTLLLVPTGQPGGPAGLAYDLSKDPLGLEPLVPDVATLYAIETRRALAFPLR